MLVGVGDGLALGQLADEPLAGLGEGDDGRDGPTALGRRDDGRLAALHDRDDGVRRAEVDADDLAHVRVLLDECWEGLVGTLLGGAGCRLAGVRRFGRRGRRGSGGGAATATSAGAQDAVAQSIAAAQLVDDLALGPAGAGHVDDGLVLARVELAARRRVDRGDALGLEQDAQLAVDGGDARRTTGRSRSTRAAPRSRGRSRRRRSGPCAGGPRRRGRGRAAAPRRCGDESSGTRRARAGGR